MNAFLGASVGRSDSCADARSALRSRRSVSRLAATSVSVVLWIWRSDSHLAASANILASFWSRHAEPNLVAARVELVAHRWLRPPSCQDDRVARAGALDGFSRCRRQAAHLCGRVCRDDGGPRVQRALLDEQRCDRPAHSVSGRYPSPLRVPVSMTRPRAGLDTLACRSSMPASAEMDSSSWSTCIPQVREALLSGPRWARTAPRRQSPPARRRAGEGRA